MNIAKYIKRIKYEGELFASFNVLKELQRSHLFNVPFENLDVHYGNPIVLDVSKFYQKIVDKKRGGFCYELNGLFHNLLNELGFEAEIISARVYDAKKGSFGEEYDHLVIIVKLNQTEYLVDVGFGAFTIYPLKLEINKIQEDPIGNFIIEKENDFYVVSKIDGDRKTIKYKFIKKKRVLEEFRGMCDFHQTSPNSHFTQKKLISRPTENGRITITGNTLKITENGLVKQNVDFPEDDYEKQLLKWFELEETKIKGSA